MKVCISRRTAQYILDAIKSSGVATNWDRDDAIADLEAALSSPIRSTGEQQVTDSIRQEALDCALEGGLSIEVAMTALAVKRLDTVVALLLLLVDERTTTTEPVSPPTPSAATGSPSSRKLDVDWGEMLPRMCLRRRRDEHELSR